MTWTCVQCTGRNVNEALAACNACNSIRVLQCPSCKGEIRFLSLSRTLSLPVCLTNKQYSRYGKRLHANGKTYHSDCFCCTACNKPLPSRFQVINKEAYHLECAPKPQTNNTRTTTTRKISEGSDKSRPVEKPSSRMQHREATGCAATGRKAAHGDGWRCSSCTFFNSNETTPSCGACETVRSMQCPGCTGKIKCVGYIGNM